jgi:hypothetical protein
LLAHRAEPTHIDLRAGGLNPEQRREVKMTENIAVMELGSLACESRELVVKGHLGASKTDKEP